MACPLQHHLILLNYQQGHAYPAVKQNFVLVAEFNILPILASLFLKGNFCPLWRRAKIER